MPGPQGVDARHKAGHHEDTKSGGTGTMGISLRARYRFTVLVFTTNEMVLGLLSIYVSPLFMIGAVAVLFSCGIYAMQIRCPVCGKPVLYNAINNLGIRMYAYMPAVPEKCTKCGTVIE
jgi:rRNA maturation protein Nop10